MRYVVLKNWQLYNEQLTKRESLKIYDQWADAAKSNIIFKPRLPVTLVGDCNNHPDETISRGEVCIETSTIRVIRPLEDAELQRGLGIKESHKVFLVETVSSSPTVYVIDIEEASRD